MRAAPIWRVFAMLSLTSCTARANASRAIQSAHAFMSECSGSSECVTLGIARVRGPDLLGAALGEGKLSQSAFSAGVAFPRYRRYRAESFLSDRAEMNGDVGFWPGRCRLARVLTVPRRSEGSGLW